MITDSTAVDKDFNLTEFWKLPDLKELTLLLDVKIVNNIKQSEKMLKQTVEVKSLKLEFLNLDFGVQFQVDF